MLPEFVNQVRGRASRRLSYLARTVNPSDADSLDTFQREFNDELKSLCIVVHTVAAGGAHRMDPDDCLALDASIDDMQFHVKRLVSGLSDGTIDAKSDAFMARVELFTKSKLGIQSELESALARHAEKRRLKLNSAVPKPERLAEYTKTFNQLLHSS